MILDDIYGVIAERRQTAVPGSYVSALLAKGKDEILKKIGEESVEVIIASSSGDKAGIVREMADLWFHCLVLMEEEGVTVQDVFDELSARRTGRKR